LLGRHKNKWEYDIKSDITRMKIKNYKDRIRDRTEWKSLVEKAKSCSASERRKLQARKLCIAYIIMSLLTENYKYVEHKITLYWSGNNWKPKQSMQGTHISVV